MSNEDTTSYVYCPKIADFKRFRMTPFASSQQERPLLEYCVAVKPLRYSFVYSLLLLVVERLQPVERLLVYIRGRLHQNVVERHRIMPADGEISDMPLRNRAPVHTARRIVIFSQYGAVFGFRRRIERKRGV